MQSKKIKMYNQCLFQKLVRFEFSLVFESRNFFVLFFIYFKFKSSKINIIGGTKILI